MLLRKTGCYAVVFPMALSVLLWGCSGDKKSKTDGKVTIFSGDFNIEGASGERITIPSGDYIQIEKYDGIEYIPVEGVLADADFKTILQSSHELSVNKTDRLARLTKPLDETLTHLQSTVPMMRVKTSPEVGYFSGLVQRSQYRDISKVKGLPYSVLLNPIVTQESSNMVRRMNEPELIKAMGDLNASRDTSDYAGLKSMGVTSFLKTVGEELGETPDGSSVKVGVSDTGITLHHPAFYNAAGKNRIVHIKDFTSEGRIFINPAAKFAVTVPSETPPGVAPEEYLMVDAQVLPPARSVVTLPTADQFLPIVGPILVHEKLRAKLLDPSKAARMGVLFEGAFAAAGESADINQNGKTDDLFMVLAVTDSKELEIYLSFTGDFDFRKSKPLRDWNATGDSVSLGSEKVGVDIRPTVLQTTVNVDATVLGISLVGYDPGNHGTHVSGLVGARKIIANDKDSTLARGAAPNVNLMMNRVCANNGGCRATEAIVDLALSGADIINMSLGGLSPFNDGFTVQEAIINRLTELEDVLFMISAGNSGPGMNTVGSPSTAKHAISVGATANNGMIQKQYQWSGKGTAGLIDETPKSDQDYMLFFSSRGPSGSGGFKPNLTAPGTELSSIQLNAAQGARSGLDVYWGTSMSAPSATGAVALLLDAARKYNKKNPTAKLPTDALTLRRVLLESAKPFNVTRFDPRSKKFEQGQYTWIDQGMGMLSLPNAWKILKKQADRALSSPVYYEEDGEEIGVPLTYEVRVADKYRNGGTYNGTAELPEEMASMIGPVYGQGVWLDLNDTRSLFKVQIARRLPLTATVREDAGELKRLLVTSMEEFSLKTVIYGSNQEWVKAGTLEQLDCSQSPSKNLILVGEGAVDPAAGVTTMQPRESSLMVCIDRSTLHSLPPGDHGALISAYRKSNGQTEATPSFVVPVYVTVPHKNLAGHDAFEVKSEVASMGVGRHYVNVPKGTSFVTVTLSVPEAKVVNGAVKDCASVKLYVNEAANTALPPELTVDPTKSVIQNCDLEGGLKNESRTLTYTRVNPAAGIWDMHVLGRYFFEKSPYELTIQFAKVDLSTNLIKGTSEVLNGSLEMKLVDYSVDPVPDAEKSRFILNQKIASSTHEVANQTVLVVPTEAGDMARQYGDDITSVTISTSESPGNDLDLTVVECEDAELSEGCSPMGNSAGASADESVSFIPDSEKFYGVAVVGYEVKDDGEFKFTEAATSKNGEEGKLTLTEIGKDQYEVTYAFDVANSKLLTDLEASDGSYELGGEIQLVTKAGSLLATVPVRVQKK